jgi:hypothetical protein
MKVNNKRVTDKERKKAISVISGKISELIAHNSFSTHTK